MAKEIYSDRRNIFGESEDYQGKDKAFDKEVERYGVINSYFNNHPFRLTEQNKEGLEKICLRMLYILKKDIPAKTEKSCLKTLNSILDKIFFHVE